MQETAIRRPTLDELHLGAGKKTRLSRLLNSHGPGNGTLMLLPYDHGIEHGPIDFFDNPESADPAYIFRLGVEGRFSGVVTHTAVAKRYYPDFAGSVPLIVKLNGRSNIPYVSDPFFASDRRRRGGGRARRRRRRLHAVHRLRRTRTATSFS